VAAGDVVFTLYTDTPQRIPAAVATLESAWSVGNESPPQGPLVIDRIVS
jgi:thymidine phosphorylase